MKSHMLKRHVHPSWIVAMISTGIVVGVIWAYELSTFASIAWLLTGSAMCLTALLFGRVWLIPLAVLGGCIIGLWRGSVDRTDLAVYESLVGSQSTVLGTVKEDVDTNKRGQIVLRLQDLVIDDRKIKGAI